ncbi:MAG: hypothetical protein WDM76_02430, partial [Limisphaerales bacterium]
GNYRNEIVSGKVEAGAITRPSAKKDRINRMNKILSGLSSKRILQHSVDSVSGRCPPKQVTMAQFKLIPSPRQMGRGSG